MTKPLDTKTTTIKELKLARIAYKVAAEFDGVPSEMSEFKGYRGINKATKQALTESVYIGLSHREVADRILDLIDELPEE